MSGKDFDDKMMFSKLLRLRLDIEAAMDQDMSPPLPPMWYARKITKSGHTIIERNYIPAEDHFEIGAHFDPPFQQIHWADQHTEILNKECHHDGAWVVGFTHPIPFAQRILMVNPAFEWRRIIKVWLDREGDIQFVVDNIEPFDVTYARGHHYFVNQCEEAWQQWKHMARDQMQLKANQLKPLALMVERGRA